MGGRFANSKKSSVKGQPPVLRQHTMLLDAKISYLTMHDNDDSSDEDEFNFPTLPNNQGGSKPTYETKMRLINDEVSYRTMKNRRMTASTDDYRESSETSLHACPSISGIFDTLT